jgi:hypothetical protein
MGCIAVPSARTSTQAPAPVRAARIACWFFVWVAAWVVVLGVTRVESQAVSPPTRVSIYGGWQCEPDLAIDGDHIVAVWSDGATSPHSSGWSYSADGGQTWSEGAPFAPRSGTERVRRHAEVAVDQRGVFNAIIGYSTNYRGFATYRGEFQSGVFGWDSITVLPLGYFLNVIYDTPSIACQAGIVYVTCARSLQDTSTVLFLRSLDGGRTWSTPLVLSGPKSNGTELIAGPDGEVYVFWEDFAAASIVGRKSVDQGMSFEPEFVVGPIYNSFFAPPGMTPDGRGNPLYYPDGIFAPTFPAMAVDRSDGPRRGWLYATWAERSNAPALPASRFGVEREPNDSWGSATPIQIGDHVYGETVGKIGGGEGFDRDVFSFDGVHGDLVRIDSQVQTLGGPVVDNFFNWYCGTDTLALTRLGQVDMFNVAVGPGPPVFYTLPVTGRYYLRLLGLDPYSTYYEFQLRRVDASGSEVARDHRDIVIVHSEDGGMTWSGKTRVNDDPPGFDNALPSVSVDGLGAVHVAWYDRRDFSGCARLAHTYWANSSDGAQSFSPAIRLSTQSSEWHGYQGDSPGANIGDHLAIASQEGRTWVLWTEIDHPDFDIYGALIEDGSVGTQAPLLRAAVIDGRVTLEWWIGGDEVTGYRIHRALENGSRFEPLQSEPVPVHGPGHFQFVDSRAEAGRAYTYRLELVRASGVPLWTDPVSLMVTSLSARLVVHAAVPNPFSGMTALDVEVPRAGRLTIRAHDTSGRCVARLFDGEVKAGRRRIEWNGRVVGDRSAPPGSYILWVKLDQEVRSMRTFKLE